MTSLAARKRLAMAEFAAIAVDVGNFPGKRDVAWWVEVRDAVCAKYDVPDLVVYGSGTTDKAQREKGS